MAKLDLKREYRHLYGPSSKECSIVEVPEMQFLMIDGAGDPNTSVAYAEAIEALYAMSYTLKFISKNTQSVDYAVMPLEGLWWTPNIAEFSIEDKSAWEWTAMMVQPEHITADLVASAANEVRRKKDPPALDRVRLERYREGLAVQIMYFGPYADEAPTIQRMHEFAIDGGYRLRGKHHEIYLSDPRRTAPEKLRTVIRQPVEGPTE
jgi:hypothetical protein